MLLLLIFFTKLTSKADPPNSVSEFSHDDDKFETEEKERDTFEYNYVNTTKVTSDSENHSPDDYSGSPGVFQTGSVSVMFLSEDSDDLCIRLRLNFHEKLGGNDTKKVDDENVAVFDMFLESNRKTPTQTFFWT